MAVLPDRIKMCHLEQQADLRLIPLREGLLPLYDSDPLLRFNECIRRTVGHCQGNDTTPYNQIDMHTLRYWFVNFRCRDYLLSLLKHGMSAVFDQFVEAQMFLDIKTIRCFTAVIGAGLLIDLSDCLVVYNRKVIGTGYITASDAVNNRKFVTKSDTDINTITVLSQ